MTDPIEPAAQPSASPSNEQVDAPKIISAEVLFAGEREICIEHAGEKYRLRITRRNKLILQK